MKQLLIVLLICIVSAAQAQNFSPKVAEKLRKYNIDSLGSVLNAAPFTFKSRDLTVSVQGIFNVTSSERYNKPVKEFGYIFSLILSGKNNSEATIY